MSKSLSWRKLGKKKRQHWSVSSEKHLEFLNTRCSDFLICQSTRDYSLFSCLYRQHSFLYCILPYKLVTFSLNQYLDFMSYVRKPMLLPSSDIYDQIGSKRGREWRGQIHFFYLHDKFFDLYAFSLSNAMDAHNSLLFNSWIPPGILQKLNSKYHNRKHHLYSHLAEEFDKICSINRTHPRKEFSLLKYSVIFLINMGEKGSNDTSSCKTTCIGLW